MSNYLVSFCNNKKICQTKKEGLVGIFNTDKMTLTNVSINVKNFNSLLGATGITKSNDFYYIIAQSKFSKLLILNQNLRVTKQIDLKPLKGVHSLVYSDGYLYMVVTKQDKVIKFNLKTFSYKVVYDLQTNKDTCHINSICFHNNKLFISAFGSNNKKHWMYADSGFIYCIDTDSKVLENLRQPHSLFSYNGSLHVCDSSRKRIIDESSKVIVQNKFGYTRGLYLEEDLIVYGISKGRTRSITHNEYIGNISDKGTITGECCLIALKRGIKQELSLKSIADEIYDIFPL